MSLTDAWVACRCPKPILWILFVAPLPPMLYTYTVRVVAKRRGRLDVPCWKTRHIGCSGRDDDDNRNVARGELTADGGDWTRHTAVDFGGSDISYSFGDMFYLTRSPDRSTSGATIWGR
ncbi:hypothetical protein H4582DRAFT_2064554 [Lactarius indigo]|nr:hypothetical protein H4582DRAFT_2064554 [Lactarius indigo]